MKRKRPVIEAPPITLTEAQTEIFISPARFKVVCCGRRFGKTFLALATLLLHACDPANAGKTYWYVAPSYRQAAQIAWKHLKRLLPQGWTLKINETDLSVELLHGTVIALRGADNYDSLRGVGLDGVVLDEAQDISPDAWSEVLRPALADRKGWGLFLGTPKGFGWFYELWSAAGLREGWQAWTFTTAQGGNVALEEIEAARAEMDERTFRQEFEASWEALAGRVYQSFERAVNVRADLEDNGGPLYVGMDFNVNPMSAVVAVRAGEQFHVLHEIEIENGNTALMCATLRKRFPGRRIAVYPDPSGKSRKTSANLGETDHTLLRDAGFHVVAPPRAELVIDRINTVNSSFRNAKNEARLFIHPRCRQLIKCLEGQTFREGTNIPDKSLGLDHLVDALGYFIVQEIPIVTRRARVVRVVGF